jgi:hypothetical protein
MTEEDAWRVRAKLVTAAALLLFAVLIVVARVLARHR